MVTAEEGLLGLDAEVEARSTRVLRDVTLGSNVTIWHWVNLYGCEIGDNSVIGSFVEIQEGVSIGKNCRISSHSFLCTGVTVADEVFIGHGAIFINDLQPSGRIEHRSRWDLQPIRVESGVGIGSGALILGGVTIGSDAIIGAGAVVTSDVPPACRVAGVPARLLTRANRPQPSEG